MVKLGLAMVVGVAPALVSWWRGQGPWLPAPLVSPALSPSPDKAPKLWPQRRSPSLSDCLESSSDEESARSVVCHVRPKLLALSKHHSMLGSKRINVLYTTQKTGKVSKTDAKSKSAKLIALQKTGKLIGSIPVNRKRSYRRMKMKRAQAKLAAESS